MSRVEQIRTSLQFLLSPTYLVVTDASHKHAGHAGARDGRGHFHVEIVSQVFAGKSSLARHRAIYAALGSLMETDIHALSIQASAPEEIP